MWHRVVIFLGKGEVSVPHRPGALSNQAAAYGLADEDRGRPARLVSAMPHVLDGEESDVGAAHLPVSRLPAAWVTRAFRRLVPRHWEWLPCALCWPRPSSGHELGPAGVRSDERHRAADGGGGVCLEGPVVDWAQKSGDRGQRFRKMHIGLSARLEGLGLIAFGRGLGRGQTIAAGEGCGLLGHAPMPVMGTGWSPRSRRHSVRAASTRSVKTGALDG